MNVGNFDSKILFHSFTKQKGGKQIFLRNYPWVHQGSESVIGLFFYAQGNTLNANCQRFEVKNEGLNISQVAAE